MHDSMVSEWSDCLRQLQIHHKCEPRDRYNDSNNRLDIAVFDVGSGDNAELDVALSHPWATDILSQASKNDGAAAARREIRKTTKYSQVKIPGVSSFSFVSLVFEHFGHWGEEATNYLQELSARSTDDGGIRTLTNSSAIGENASRQLYSIAMQRQLLENYPLLPLQELVM